MGDIGARIDESQNWFERAAKRIPGYKGYKEKELRREADRLQRGYVAERLEGARRKLEDLNLALTNRGDIRLLGVVDASSRRLRTVKDRILYADYGYAGLFDTVKVDEQVLDQLYLFDTRMQEEAQGIEGLVLVLTADSPSLRTDIDLLDARIKALDEYFAQREHIVTGVGGGAVGVGGVGATSTGDMPASVPPEGGAPAVWSASEPVASEPPASVSPASAPPVPAPPASVSPAAPPAATPPEGGGSESTV